MKKLLLLLLLLLLLVCLPLILFLGTTTEASKPIMLELPLPPPPPPSISVQIKYVDDNNPPIFYIDNNKVDENNLEQEISNLIKDTEEPGIILHADYGVDIKHVVKVMDIASRNKYKITLNTTEK